MLSPHEVLEIALRIENEGADFYRDLAESTDNENQGSVFRFLSSQERRHAETFRALLKRFQEEAAELVNWDNAGAYMEDLTEEAVFSGRLHDAMSSSDYDEAIALAIEVERKSIAFYRSFVNNVKAETADALKKIVAEEERHIELLEGLR
ncbi:MAG: ferritin family protein [Mesotoga sp.]|uniref:ferritin family protein n=1 Tax=unclassified Mesotoga TaxID=1184398 RepID=UPI000EF26D7F|nr:MULTISPECIES: ferritin family protein [unclassified Mesotoga]MDI9368074.1 ferritin family protein [Thermotogota bacterium]MDD2333565.1 ferritin family protein [Mesotoga sp.]MDD3680846.1 ferritin family protein [Mesotoga sp.]MDD4207408.1 ferritin family protein [Mesotoga sp.]MDD4826805.1 ferritin family protein [Mesotoga sp.]